VIPQSWLETTGNVTRVAVGAAPGKRLLGGDLVAIESTGTAWIAGTRPKLDQWIKSIRTGDPLDDPYFILGKLFGFPDETARKYGKIGDLAFGYGGGVGAYRNFAPEDDTTTDEQIKGFQRTWRDLNEATVTFWRGIERTAISAVFRSPEILTYGKLSLQCPKLHDIPFLFIKLPSGREISYPFAKVVRNDRGHAALSFMDNAEGGWRACGWKQGKEWVWGGTLTENIVQGIARDLLAAALHRLRGAGYAPVLHVHDEIVVEMPIGEGSIDEFKYLVEIVPDWATGWPIAVKVRNGPRWANVDVPIVHVPGATEPPPPKAKAAKIAPAYHRLGPVLPGIAKADDFPNLESFAGFVRERHSIYERRQAGQAPPWTDDPILREWRFCNTYRALDAETIGIQNEYLWPHRDDPHLWFALVIARLINKTSTLKAIGYPVPWDAERFVAAMASLPVGQRYGNAYVIPAGVKEVGRDKHLTQAEHIFGPLWRDREQLMPRPGMLVADFTDRLRRYPGLGGGFLAAQVASDAKQVEPLASAADHATFALSGPGSRLGLNYLLGRSADAAWRADDTDWYPRLSELHQLIVPRYLELRLPIPDYQDTQNQLCEFSKYWAIRSGDKGRLKRRYIPPGTDEAPAARKAKTKKKASATAPMAEPIIEATAEPVVEPVAEPVVEPVAGPVVAPELPDYIAADMAATSSAAAPTPAPATAPARAKARQKGDGYPRGERATGRRVSFYIYRDARERYYLGVERTSTKQFPQYHWTGTQWAKGLPKGFLKIPYRLPELLDADPGAWVVIAAGEKDAETAARLGFVATTNPGGEGKGQWTPELGKWFAGRQRVAIMEDNDPTGFAHAIEVANALRGIVPDIRIIAFRELPAHGDLTDWVEVGARSRGAAGADRGRAGRGRLRAGARLDGTAARGRVAVAGASCAR
jgi:DNA polymerase